MKGSKYFNCPLGTKWAVKDGLTARWDQTEIILPKRGNQYYVISVGQSNENYSDIINPHGNLVLPIWIIGIIMLAIAL
jgi:hypothetical protein